MADDIQPAAGGPPSGAAGGELGGNYPNPTVVKVAAVTPGAGGLAILDDADAATMRTTLGLGTAALISSTAGGDLTGTLPNPTLAAAGPGATGPLGGATVAPIVTIDAKGRVTALSSATISGVVPSAHATTHEDGGSDAAKIGVQRTPTASKVVAAGYSVVVSKYFEIAEPLTVEIAATAHVEVIE